MQVTWIGIWCLVLGLLISCSFGSRIFAYWRTGTISPHLKPTKTSKKKQHPFYVFLPNTLFPSLHALFLSPTFLHPPHAEETHQRTIRLKKGTHCWANIQSPQTNILFLGDTRKSIGIPFLSDFHGHQTLRVTTLCNKTSVVQVFGTHQTYPPSQIFDSLQCDDTSTWIDTQGLLHSIPVLKGEGDRVIFQGDLTQLIPGIDSQGDVAAGVGFYIVPNVILDVPFSSSSSFSSPYTLKACTFHGLYIRAQKEKKEEKEKKQKDKTTWVKSVDCCTTLAHCVLDKSLIISLGSKGTPLKLTAPNIWLGKLHLPKSTSCHAQQQVFLGKDASCLCQGVDSSSFSHCWFVGCKTGLQINAVSKRIHLEHSYVLVCYTGITVDELSVLTLENVMCSHCLFMCLVLRGASKAIVLQFDQHVTTFCDSDIGVWLCDEECRLYANVQPCQLPVMFDGLQRDLRVLQRDLTTAHLALEQDQVLQTLICSQ